MKKINMKKFIIFMIAGSFCFTIRAQQLPQLTQYMMNNYAINPAFAGGQDYFQATTTVRSMWGDIGPKTTLLSIYGKKGENMGIGGMVYNDEEGPTSRIGGTISYTHHFALTDDIKVALALSGGFLQYRLVKDQLTVADRNDPFFVGGDVVRSLPDATFGINASGNNWYAGFSVPQLLSMNLNLLDTDFQENWNKETDGKLVRHYYVLAGYKHVLNPFWSVEPSVLFKHVTTATQLDVSVKAMWDDRLWIGTGYRTSGEISGLLGYTINERYTIGYSYDMLHTLGPSHEFVLGIRFLQLKQEEILKKDKE